jgi:hypothetical protein
VRQRTGEVRGGGLRLLKTRDFAPTNAAEATSKAMTTKTEKQKTLLTIPKVQLDRIKAVAAKQTARADGPPMKLEVVDGALQIIFTHADTDLVHILMMADLGTCDPSFMAGVQIQTAGIGAHSRTIDEGASNFLLSVVPRRAT